MSKYVEKTFLSLNSVLNNSGLFSNVSEKSANKFHCEWATNISSFVNKLKNVESKQEEEDVINTCLSIIERKLSDPVITNAEVENMIKICMICENMGYASDFIYVHSLKLAQTGNLQEKHTGYSAATFFLHPDHELVVLLINTIQKDLCSSNHREVLLALTSVCNLINAETVHNVLHLVVDRLNHQKSTVRKLAVLTLGHCLYLADSQSSYEMTFPKLESTLTDVDLEVVSVAVPTVHKIVKKLPGNFTYLISSLTNLLDQIIQRRIPQSMNYCDIPAPWLQIDILKFLSHLCQNMEHFQVMIPVVKKLFQGSSSHPLSHAVMYQAIETVTCIGTSTELSDMVLSSVSTFLKSKNANLKLMGLEALVLIVEKIKPTISSAQQQIIMECLKLPDETLQLKTLELMYQLANPSNVQAICRKMTEFLSSTTSEEKKRELALKILQLAEKFVDRVDWYISTVTAIFRDVGHLLPSTTIFSIINLITKDDNLKTQAKKYCIELCKETESLPSCVMKLYASVISTTSEFEGILAKIPTSDENAIIWFLVSLMEVILKTREISATLHDFLRKLNVKQESAKQVLNQLLEIIENISNLRKFDAEEMDPTLTFLDRFVLQALERKSVCYQPYSFRTNFLLTSTSNLDFQNDSFSVISSEGFCGENSVHSSYHKSPTYSAFSSPSISFQSLPGEKDFHSPFILKNKTIWTKEGRKKSTTPSGEDGLSNKEEQNTRIEHGLQKDDDLLELFAGIS